jgi:hypothetical protein
LFYKAWELMYGQPISVTECLGLFVTGVGVGIGSGDPTDRRTRPISNRRRAGTSASRWASFFASMGMQSLILSGNPSTPLRLLCGAPASVGKTFLRAYPAFPLRHKPLQSYDCDAVVEEGGGQEGDAQQGDPCRVGGRLATPPFGVALFLRTNV